MENKNLQYAKEELKRAGFYDKDAMYGELLPNAVLELLDVFTKQGHSGMSAGVTVNLFKRLALHEPLVPITDKPEEWTNALGGEESTMYQHTRLSSLFKNGKDGKGYYLDAIVWQGEEDYDTFTGRNVKKEYYDGKPEDLERYYEEDYTDGTKKYYKYVIKDRKQLDEVFTYYEEYPVEK